MIIYLSQNKVGLATHGLFLIKNKQNKLYDGHMAYSCHLITYHVAMSPKLVNMQSKIQPKKTDTKEKQNKKLPTLLINHLSTKKIKTTKLLF